jgi:hypothetical protein
MTIAAMVALAGTANAQAPVGEEGRTSIRDLRSFEVVDAKGRLAGRLFALYAVQMAVGARSYLIILDQQPRSLASFTYSQAVQWLYYTSSDCTGSAYLPYGMNGTPVAGPPSALTATDPSTGQVLLYPARPDIVNLTLNSLRIVNGGQCIPQTFTSDAVSLMDPMDITNLYALPFQIK